MAVSIRIKGEKETNEYSDALSLKQIFENEFSKKDTNGEILIISNATLFGQDVKDVDLIVIGNLDNYSCKIKTKAHSGSYNDRIEEGLEERLVYINSFCFVIETKRQRAEDIQLNGLNLLVYYNDKLHDVTTQSEKQKYALKGYFKDRLNSAPYICNLIWFRNIDWISLKRVIGDNENISMKHNYLPNIFSVSFLLQLACVQSIPYRPTDKVSGKLKNYVSFSCLKSKSTFNLNEMSTIFELFEKVKFGMGELSRKKIEHITSKLLDQQQYAKAIGEKLIIISGRAGTGKTIKLLRIACDLAHNKGARSLILTYNHALVSDIKRTLALIEIPDGIDDYCINISTLHKFFYELLLGFGIVKNPDNPESPVKYIPDYLANYNNYLEELNQYIESGVIEEKEIAEIMISRHDTVAYDFLLIDESQDWNNNEKAIIFKLFGKNKIIIADGVDQLIRNRQKCNWTHRLKPEVDFIKRSEKKGLRQEVNLVSFINSYANKLGIHWELEPKQELIGGKIIITTKGYNKDLHYKEFNVCKEKGNSAYEMMFLVPPSLAKIKSISDAGIETISRGFKLTKEFGEMGIDLWDGTKTDLRTQYPVELNQHRLLQYESCRGLEGWTVVCLDFDEFIKYKMETYIEEATGELGLETMEEKRNKFVYLWSIIPLTRAIESLIITIADKESKVCKTLRKVYEENPDFIQWIE